MTTLEPDTAKPEPKDRRQRGLPHRLLVGLLKLTIGLALWGLILFVLALFFVPSKSASKQRGVTRATVEITTESFASPEVCGGCHWDLFTQWSDSLHSAANEDPLYVAVYELAQQDTGGKAETFCDASRCHSPSGFLAGEDPFPHSRMSEIARQGVFCDFCHTVSGGRSPVGDASYVSTPGRIKRGPYRDAESPSHQTAYSPLHTSSKFCGACHNVSSPITGLKLEATYDEWEKSSYNRRNPATNTECQDCHMRPYAGRAATIGPKRAQVFSHYFAGATTFDAVSSARKRKMATARLKSAARLSLVRAEREGGRVNLSVRVANVGAGHYLPTGITELREMWLEVVVLDDHRVPPRGSVIERYSFDAPSSAGPLRLTVRLLYRSASQELVDTLLGDGRLDIPVVEMTRLTSVID
ncbi:MAG: hypothetical protein C4521_13385 [Actinobacteria bacterium]|nr:MAG: hypothetical protein C4521_13385 [Actinomycetota bacterium]